MKSVVYLGCPPAERVETEQALVAAGVSVVWADSVALTLSELQRSNMPVLLDLSRGASALHHARELRTRRASTLIFAVVDAHRPELTTEAVLAGMADVFARPLGGRRVANAIERELAYESAAPVKRSVMGVGVDNLYTHSNIMREVMTLVARAAAMRAGVIIQGEEGTGRQLLARSIHGLQTAAGPFLTIDCAAFDGDALDIALFGLVARSTNGDAHGLERVGKRSLLCEAQGGTLYLQHVVEAPARVQSRLARVLRDREAVLADTGHTVALDVRPMASIESHVDRLVQEGRVREDLLRRLSVIHIEMPTLRSRREDIPALANYFVREICAGLRVPPKTLSRAALSLMAALPWRGNAIELRTLLENIITGLGDNRSIGIEELLAHVRLDGGSLVFASGGTLKQARARFEREYIAAVLDQHRGRISDAAKTLGVQRTNLYRKMRALRVNWNRDH